MAPRLAVNVPCTGRRVAILRVRAQPPLGVDEPAALDVGDDRPQRRDHLPGVRDVTVVHQEGHERRLERRVGRERHRREVGV